MKKKPNRSNRQLKKLLKKSLLMLAHEQPEHFNLLVEAASHHSQGNIITTAEPTQEDDA